MLVHRDVGRVVKRREGARERPLEREGSDDEGGSGGDASSAAAGAPSGLRNTQDHSICQAI
jgi:hypothetical protein